MQVIHTLVSNDLMQVTGNRTHIAVNGPLVIVQHHDQPLCLLGDVIECLKRDSVRESSIASQSKYVFIAAGKIASNRHAQCCRERGSGVSSPVYIMFALCAEHEAVQTA